MKNVFLMIVMILVVSSCTNNEKDLIKSILAENYYGETKNVTGWTWVDVMNLEPVEQKYRNGSHDLVYGDICGCEEGTIQERGVDPDGRILYEYTAHGDPMGTPCPSGVLFFSN